MSSEAAWERHYTRDKSLLVYPDENLVRMLKSFLADRSPEDLRALDLGCGTGRHLRLLRELGVSCAMGVDSSFNALAACAELQAAMLLQGDALRLPFRDASLDLVVAWGSLHYSTKEGTALMLAEIRRVMKTGGRLFGTLRNERDSHLRRGAHLGRNTWSIETKDLKNAVVSFFSEEELRGAFGSFQEFKYGVMERSLLGEPGALISHWFFRAVR